MHPPAHTNSNAQTKQTHTWAHAHTHTNIQTQIHLISLGNSNLQPLLESLFAQIQIDLSWRGFSLNLSMDLRITQICSVPRSCPLSYGDGCITENPAGPSRTLQECIRDDIKLAQLVRARDCQSRGRGFDSSKNSKTEKSNLHGLELHRPWPSSKGTKLLFPVIKAIFNQCADLFKYQMFLKKDHLFVRLLCTCVF